VKERNLAAASQARADLLQRMSGAREARRETVQA